MPDFAIVDRTKLDAAMRATADAIREKQGNSLPMVWDEYTGFEIPVSAIDLDARAKTVEDEFLLGTYANVDNDRVTSIVSNALRNMPGLKTVKVDNVETIGEYAMYSCASLTKCHAAKATTLAGGVFYGDTRLVDVVLTAAETIGVNCFYACRGLTTLELPSVNSIGNNAFNGCNSLKRLIIGTDLCTIGTGAFTGTPIANGDGYIYVPDVMVEAYKAATNWSDYASKIKGLSEVPA